MPYSAKVFNILIASPSDVSNEREIIASIIQEWNNLHSYEKKVVLLPLRWETHSAPEMGQRPQEVINKEVVDYCDMAIGVFWTRIGTPTGGFQSGTIEEIERVGKAGKIVMCYFSRAPISPDEIDQDQYQRLKEFKSRTYPEGLVENYSDISDFKEKFARQLEIKVRELISKYRSDNIDQNNPCLEIAFYSPLLKATFGPELNIKTKNLILINEEKIPDFNAKMTRVTALPYLNFHEQIYGSNNYSKNYYREYANYLREDWGISPLQFELFNSGDVLVRDIYIEINIERNSNIFLTDIAPTQPVIYYGSSSIISHDHISELLKKEYEFEENNDNFYVIKYNVGAIQAQRKLLLDGVFFIGTTENAKIECNIKIYADYLSQPIDTKLTIYSENETLKMDAVELLTELEIIK